MILNNSITKYNEAEKLFAKLPKSARSRYYKTKLMFNRARAFHKKGHLLVAACDYKANLRLNEAHDKA